MAEIEFVRATKAHVPYLAARMRAADRDEVMAASGSLPAEALSFSISHSQYAMTATADGFPIAAFGVGGVSVLTGLGCPWLLGTDDLVLHRRALVEHSRPFRDAFLRRYPVLQGVVDDRNKLSIRWLKWMGFTVSRETIPIGRERRPFRVFRLEVGRV